MLKTAPKPPPRLTSSASRWRWSGNEPASPAAPSNRPGSGLPVSRAPAPWGAAFLLLAASAAAYFLSSSSNFLLGQIASPILGLTALHGLSRGGLRKLIMLPLTCAVLCAVANAHAIFDPVLNGLGVTSLPIPVELIAIILGVVTLILASQILKSVRRRRIEPRRAILALDRFGGSLIGAAEGALVVLAFCWVAVLIRPHAIRIRDQGMLPLDNWRLKTAGALIQLSDEALKPPLGEFVTATNLIERMPELNNAIQQLNATGRFDLGTIDPKTLEKLRPLIESLSPESRKNLEPLLQQLEQSAPAKPTSPPAQ